MLLAQGTVPEWGLKRGLSPKGDCPLLERALAKLDDTLTRATPRKLRRAFAAVEEFFVGTCYAATTLPAGMKLNFYHGDHLGSVNLITDHTGAQMELDEYKPFGNFSRKESVRPEPVEGRSSIYYTGKRLDSTTGLYYYGARYYDPQLGRFTQPDTIVQAPSDPQTLNRYTYCRNNPIIYTDPTGHSFWKKAKSFFKAAAAIVIGVAVTVLTGGFAAPAALAWGGFAMGFSGTLINGGSIGQAIGMGLVGAFAGGVGGVAFSGLGGVARIAAMTAIGATAGASGAAIMGGNIGLGALAGGAAGFLGGAVGGRLADSWGPGMGRAAAGIATAAGAGAASSAIAGGSPGMGAALGAFGAITVAVAASMTSSPNLQAGVDKERRLHINVVHGATGKAQRGDPGHAWITLEGPDGAMSYGYWPQGLSARPGFADGGLYTPDVSLTYLIGKEQFGNVMQYINNVQTQTAGGNMNWSLSTNCTDIAVGAARAAGIPAPDMTTTTWGVSYSDPNKLADWLANKQ